MPEKKKIRYAVVGLGWIAQETVLPAFTNTSNSELTALVTGDPQKARELSDAYKVPHTLSYDEYESFLRSGEVDAVYIASPNSEHAGHSIRAARAGVHVLCEKPMAPSAEECEAMIQAAADNHVQLMIAYRLHFERTNLKAIEVIQKGQIGDPRFFSSVFSQQVKPGNVRLRKDLGGGPLMDMGVYCINAARYVFRDEPVEVMAMGGNNGEPRFREVHEAVSAMLRFPGDRLASFTCSLGADSVDSWYVVGTEGSLHLQPGFEYHEPMNITAVVNGKEYHREVKPHDQFGAEIQYFSECILENHQPEPDGYEGLADVRIVEALLESMRAGRPVQITRTPVHTRPEPDQKIELSKVKAKEIVHAESPSQG
jgi:predicted dehydrogenase